MSIKKPTSDTVSRRIPNNTSTSKKANPTQAPENKGKFPLVGVIAAVAALVLLVVLLLKVFAK